jgi:alanyl-tRNA synthetase
VTSLGTLGAVTVTLTLHDLDGTDILTMNTSATR